MGFVVCLVAAENLRDGLVGDSGKDYGIFLVHDASPVKMGGMPVLPMTGSRQESVR
ncbi:hypothetical protein AFE_1312 [Acidithiobacillus ferrooxidans ATCC 23270]|uniref:Uncharacterized protein n=1 Tax=Acidithiobacillus ferrooxidans (strain ATCC 23270 / DSM 14882 / CIP 104768 / NCIMB 8455) TaxID=243159 RepID=B7J9B7_ACIF2|nr:hypothetical protein AFE_1312 [Acidithiobacillus ferrooxidans ATCC 23270]